jgi:hypothetical protein
MSVGRIHGKVAAAGAAAAFSREDHLLLSRVWVSAEAAAVLAAADARGSRRTLPAALAARAEVVSLRDLAMGPSIRTTGIVAVRKQ